MVLRYNANRGRDNAIEAVTIIKRFSSLYLFAGTTATSPITEAAQKRRQHRNITKKYQIHAINENKEKR